MPSPDWRTPSPTARTSYAWPGRQRCAGQGAGEVEGLEQLELVRSRHQMGPAGLPPRSGSRSTVSMRVPTRAAPGRPGPRALRRIPIDTGSRSTWPHRRSTFPHPAGAGPAPRAVFPLVGKPPSCSPHATRPAIVAGSGVWWSGACEQLRAFVEHTRVPVVTRQSGRGTIPDDHPLCFGHAAGQNVVYRADVVLVIGKQLDYFFGYGFFPHLEHLIQVDINPAEIGRNRVPVSVGIVADAGAALTEFTSAMKPLPTDEVGCVPPVEHGGGGRREGPPRSSPTRSHSIRCASARSFSASCVGTRRSSPTPATC